MTEKKEVMAYQQHSQDDESLEDAVIRLEQEKQQLKAHLQDLTDAWEGVRVEVKSDCEARERLRARLKAAAAEAETEKCGRAEAELRVKSLQAELDSKQHSVAQFTERCERISRERAELRTSTAELRAKLKESHK